MRRWEEGGSVVVSVAEEAEDGEWEDEGDAEEELESGEGVMIVPSGLIFVVMSLVLEAEGVNVSEEEEEFGGNSSACRSAAMS